MESEVNNELLISEVYKRRAIWDKRNPSHANRKVIAKLWAEISAGMNIEDVILRKKWKYLRDQFAVECGKIPKGTTGMGADEESFHSKWPFFKSLLFLKDIVAPRNSTGNLSAKWFQTKSPCPKNVGAFSSTGPHGEENSFTTSHPQDSEIETESFENNQNEFVVDEEGGEKELNQDPVANSCTYAPTTTKPFKKRGRSEEFNSSLLRIEGKKLEYLLKKGEQRKSLEDDADLYFFKSLIPHVKRIPDERKMAFRSHIQSIVDEFAYPYSRAHELMVTHSPSTSSSSYSLNNAATSAEMITDPFATAFMNI